MVNFPSPHGSLLEQSRFNTFYLRVSKHTNRALTG
uniref:Uncharacterized protein n=1 Tax=Anguilla anguilla TaxID=7936 RepID=A0A0E9TCV7_ANGAN